MNHDSFFFSNVKWCKFTTSNLNNHDLYGITVFLLLSDGLDFWAKKCNFAAAMVLALNRCIS